ncbi:hypothetical protein ACVBEH_21130 [Roseateles sp. GG27B]
MNYPSTFRDSAVPINDPRNAADALRDKLIDAQTPGYQAEFDPEEAERAGAFVEDALSEEDAAASHIDLIDPIDLFDTLASANRE